MLSAKCQLLWCGLRLLLYRVILIFDWHYNALSTLSINDSLIQVLQCVKRCSSVRVTIKRHDSHMHFSNICQLVEDFLNTDKKEHTKCCLTSLTALYTSYFFYVRNLRVWFWCIPIYRYIKKNHLNVADVVLRIYFQTLTGVSLVSENGAVMPPARAILFDNWINECWGSLVCTQSCRDFALWCCDFFEWAESSSVKIVTCRLFGRKQ